jgi:hypothetical protein
MIKVGLVMTDLRGLGIPLRFIVEARKRIGRRSDNNRRQP